MRGHGSHSPGCLCLAFTEAMGPDRVLPAPQPVEGKCSFSECSFSPRMVAALPRVKSLNQPMLSLFESHMWTCTHCHGYSVFCVLLCVGTHSCPFCLSRRSTLTLAKLQMLPLCLIFPETQKCVLENCSPMCLSIVWRKGKPRISSAPSQIMVGYSQQHRQPMW